MAIYVSPTQADGSGVDQFVATLSAGPALKAVVAGLLPDASLESAQRLTQTIYPRIVDSISLQDHRRSDELIDGLLRLRPDIVVMTGGTDGGASRSILKDAGAHRPRHLPDTRRAEACHPLCGEPENGS